MSDNRTYSDYLQKAALYDLLGQFFKYSNPNLHIEYYRKHLKYMNKANRSIRIAAQSIHEEAKVRFLHTSYDAPNLDIYINGNRRIKDLPFKQVSNVLPFKPGKYHIDIYPTGNLTDSVLNKNITVEPGKSYTLASIDQVKKMRLLSFQDQPSVPINEAKVRFIHLSPDTNAIDIAVKDRDVFFPNVHYKQATDYLGLTPMTVDLEVRGSGTKNVILPLPKIHFKANETYSIVIVGLNKERPKLQAIILVSPYNSTSSGA